MNSASIKPLISTSELGPFIHQQRTLGDYCGMSEKCQIRKSPQITRGSLAGICA
jgi:hypothetical protein